MRLLNTVLAAGMMAMVALVGLIPEAGAQIYPTTYGTFSDVPGTIAASTTLTTNSAAITVRQGRGVAILPEVQGDAASTANLTFTFEVSADGTNYTTTGPLTAVVALNGTTVVRGFTLLDATKLNNVRSLRISKIQNEATNGVTITAVTWSVGN